MPTLADLALRLKSPPGSAGRSALPRLILLTDRDRMAEPWTAVARLPAGTMVILRHPDGETRRDLGRRLAAICRMRRLTLSVAGDLDLAISLRAGLHLADGVFPSIRARLWRRRRRRPLTTAAHSGPALVRARRIGADAALLSPVFATASHPSARGLGPLAFRVLTRRAKLPVYPLGGITALTLRRLAGCPIAGVAAIGALI